MSPTSAQIFGIIYVQDFVLKFKRRFSRMKGHVLLLLYTTCSTADLEDLVFDKRSSMEEDGVWEINIEAQGH